ncbi:hypothetical protein [Chryseobacterium sp. SNU WT5]|nr:hypothetical protein [Chryseobacterium sp. SNU WT5]
MKPQVQNQKLTIKRKVIKNYATSTPNGDLLSTNPTSLGTTTTFF